MDLPICATGGSALVLRASTGLRPMRNPVAPCADFDGDRAGLHLHRQIFTRREIDFDADVDERTGPERAAVF